ncbi:hypothetical protein HAX54_014279 [Datura stramonium]|uniref:NAC domain-containing protein n=1 Tax=Datura stramonium TaxID=4076 RepID=A0ABS8TMV1_DATST|nr:hypothetical protein [Datura stramonium]
MFLLERTESKFGPTDEELLVHYLSRKIFSLPLPASIIPQVVDVFHCFPSDLAGDLREKRYFLSKTNGDISSRLRPKPANSCSNIGNKAPPTSQVYIDAAIFL